MNTSSKNKFFDPAEFETFEIQDESSDPAANGVARLKFILQRDHKARLFLRSMRKFNTHKVTLDGAAQTVRCIESNCAICEAEKVDNPNAAPMGLILIPTYDALNELFGALAASFQQETDGDGAVRKKIKKGALIALLQPLLGSKSEYVDMVLRKPDQYTFQIRVLNNSQIIVPEAALAALLRAFESEEDHTFSAFFDSMTREEMLEIPCVRNTLKK